MARIITPIDFARCIFIHCVERTKRDERVADYLGDRTREIFVTVTASAFDV
jgi:hypothetical protein